MYTFQILYLRLTEVIEWKPNTGCMYGQMYRGMHGHE
jgi:hypothetical protein